MANPKIIQGGMGIAVSNWKLAKAVSQTGNLGVISGTVIGLVLARRLQMGDSNGDSRRALAHFPNQEVAQRIIDKYYIPGGKPENIPFKTVPMLTMPLRSDVEELIIAAAFTEVWLAKEGHSGVVGMNVLEKVQLPHVAALFGAMLAGVDYILMGAGIPTQVPGVLDALAEYRETAYKIDVDLADKDDNFEIRINPAKYFPDNKPQLKRPQFLAIISSAVLGKMLIHKSSGKVNGFVVEGPTAGGHNAPPRGPMKLNEKGEPIYGDRDAVNFQQLRELGLPFWMAGSYAHPDMIQKALDEGAMGIQAGTIFALCDESGFAEDVKQAIRTKGYNGDMSVFTDPLASPTGFPFKVALLDNTLSENDVYQQRPRRCDIGRLRTPYKRSDGIVGYKCPAEPLKDYIRKGGKEEDTAGRKCLCNALMANIDLGQAHPSGYQEEKLVTLGDDLSFLRGVMCSASDRYTAADALEYLMQNVKAESAIGVGIA